MSMRSALLAARPHIAVVLGLLTAAALVSRLETPSRPVSPPLPAGEIPSARHGVLSEEEVRWGRAAWRYFQRNTQPNTGLANSTDGRTITTMWDTGSHLLAMISAFRLGIIDKVEFDQRLERALKALVRIPLVQGQLPNRFYHTATLVMVDADGRLSEQGIGWSAVDLAHVLVPLHIIVWNYPDHAAAARAVVRRWHLIRLSQDGASAVGQLKSQREGHGPYAAYAAKAVALLGVDVSDLRAAAEFVEFVPVEHVQVPVGARPAKKKPAHKTAVGEPYIFDGLEFGWDSAGREGAFRVFRAQENRYLATGKLTAPGSGPVDEAPYFVYNTIYAVQKPWNTFGPDGQERPDLRFLSSGDAIGWNALYDSGYSRQLADKAGTLFDPELGWYGGWYEAKDRPNRAIGANTNAMVLESLHFRQFGKLVAVYAGDLADEAAQVGTEAAVAEGSPLPAPHSAAESRTKVMKASGHHAAAKPHAAKKSKSALGRGKKTAKAPPKPAAKPKKKRR